MNPPVKRKLTIKGRREINGAVFNTFIKLIAEKAGICGLSKAKKRPGGAMTHMYEIEVYCEGGESAISDFIKVLERGVRSGPLVIVPAEVAEYKDGDDEYDFPAGEFHDFETEYAAESDKRQDAGLDALNTLLLAEVIKNTSELCRSIGAIEETLKEIKGDVKKAHATAKDAHETQKEMSGELRRLSGGIKDTKKRKYDPSVM